MNNIFEPFRIKSVEPLKITTKEERQALIRDAGYNVAMLKSEDVLIDLLTDSGVSAMSTNQWAAMQLGDESYIGSSSYYDFQSAARKHLPFKHIIPTHQGRAADKILSSIVAENGAIIPSNSHFDTIRSNLESLNSNAVDLVIKESEDLCADHPFKGNMDIARLADLLKTQHEKVPLVMMMITNNSVGGQPVSMENIRKTSELCKKYNKPLIFDGCRFAENAYFIKIRENGYSTSSIESIAKEMFSFSDGMTMSAKKDGMVNIGGWLALNDDEWAAKAIDMLLLTEGFITYGGLSGRDLSAMAVGIGEGLNEDYLKYRVGQVEHLGNALDKIGIPVLKPFGGHAIFIDAHKWFSHLSKNDYPGQTLLMALYENGGIRACETNSIYLDSMPKEKVSPYKPLVRLSIPRRVYTKSHLDYIIKVFEGINERKAKLNGLEMLSPPTALRHYAAKFIPRNSI